MPKYINVNLLNSQKLYSVKGVVIHNDAGAMTAEQYVPWLTNRDKNLGIAHYYIDRNTIARVVDTFRVAYHCGDGVGPNTGNGTMIGYEVCQSMSANDKDFLANEDMTLMQATEDLLFYGLPINENTVRLHHEFVPTSCPHRSMALHGGTTASTKAYFIQRMKHFASLGKTVEEMITGKPVQKVEQPKAQTATATTVTASAQGVGGGSSMNFTYQIKGSKDHDEKTVYFYNSATNTIISLTNPDQLVILRNIYKDCNGREMPHYTWTPGAPWWVRFIQAVKPKFDKAG